MGPATASLILDQRVAARRFNMSKILRPHFGGLVEFIEPGLAETPASEQPFGNAVCQDPVDLFGHLAVEGAKTGLDMDEFRAGLALDAARERFAALNDEARTDATALGISTDAARVRFQRALPRLALKVAELRREG